MCLRASVILWLVLTSGGAVSDGRNAVSPKACADYARSCLQELKPQWTPELRESYCRALHSALETPPDTEEQAARLEVVLRELPIMLVELPDRVTSPAQEAMVIAEMRWSVTGCLTRPARDDPTRAQERERLREQVKDLIARTASQIHSDLPGAHPAWISLAAHKCWRRCTELQDCELAPILKSPMEASRLEAVYAAWERNTRAMRQADIEKMPPVQAQRHISAVCMALATAIWQTADMPQDMRTALTEYRKETERLAAARADASQRAAQVRTRWGTKLETIEHWGTVMQVVLKLGAGQQHGGLERKEGDTMPG